MTFLIAGLVLFLGVHTTSIVASRWRNDLVQRMGEGPWKGLYSALAVVGLSLIVFGYAAARTQPVLVWAPPAPLRHVALLLLVPVFPLLLAAYLPGRIQRATKHPMLLATKIWALSHLLVNGMLADLLLFGGFLLWAVADRVSLKRRGKPGPDAPEGSLRNDLIAVVVGLGLYVLTVVWAHQALIGVAPI